MEKNISSQFLECTRMRSPLPMPRAASAAASAETCASISRQVQRFSAQIKPGRSPWRRAFWVTMCARFITRRDIRPSLPSGFAALTGAALTSATPHEHAGADQHQPDHAGDDAMLHVNMRHAILMAREEARQLIRGNHEIDGGDNEQDDADQAQQQLHGVSS